MASSLTLLGMTAARAASGESGGEGRIAARDPASQVPIAAATGVAPAASARDPENYVSSGSFALPRF